MADENEIQEYSTTPDVDALKADLERCRNTLSYYIDRSEEARDTRMSVWPNKNRYAQKLHDEAFPWVGASDLEPQVINPLIDGDIAILKSSLNKGNLIASPVESGDITSAKMVTEFIRWRMSSMDELPREAGVAANYLLEQGICIIGTYFSREVTRVFKPISLEELPPELATAISDPDLREEVSDLFRNFFPNLSKRRINKMLKELRKDGTTEISTEKVTKSRPSIRSYELGRDIIFDANIFDLQSARAIYCVHHFTPEQLKEKVKTENWDEDFVDEVIENTTGDHDHNVTQGYAESMGAYMAEAPHAFDGLIKIIVGYRKELDEDGIPVCCMTVFSEQSDGYAKKYILDADDGNYPFVAITRENISRRLLDSRGYPELLRSYEYAVKTCMDQRRDSMSLSTNPAIEHLVGRPPTAVGPGARIPVRRRGEVGFMEIPPQTPASMEVEMQLRQLASKMTGRATGADDAVEANIIRQSMINNWLHGWSLVLKKIWALDREYNQSVWFRVTNNSQGMNIVMDETASQYDFQLTFNSMNNDEEKVMQKLEKVGQVMASLDRNGQGRYDVLLRIFLDALDPNLSSQLIAPAQEATTKEIIETSNDIAKISSGQVVNPPQQGTNPQLRLQVLQQWLTGTETIPADDIQMRIQEDEKFRQRIETYQKQLTFMLTQQENARIGQLGTAPGNMPASVAA
jgi:hypothetical protein